MPNLNTTIFIIILLLIALNSWWQKNRKNANSQPPLTPTVGKGIIPIIPPFYVISGALVCMLFYYADLIGWQINDFGATAHPRPMGPGHFHK